MDQEWTSEAVSDTLQPVWSKNNVVDLLVYDRAQGMQMDVLDDDILQDDWIGHTTLHVGEATGGNHVRTLYTHDGAIGGNLTFRGEWFGTDIAGKGDFDKCFVVVKVR